MNNEPVVWISEYTLKNCLQGNFTDEVRATTKETTNCTIPLYTHPEKDLTETDLILILEVLIDSYDDTNRGFLEYEAMYKNSPMRKARIDGMKRMVDKHTHAIEMVEAILRKAQNG